MSINHQMNYYDYAKTLSAEGNMTALIGGGAGPEPEQHEYVDLGLPSGTLWATTNIQDDDGNDLYFAWGETSGYTAEQVGTDKNFNWEDYQWGNPNSGTLITDELVEDGVLKSDYDAATANWGDGWRMPTKAEIEELMELKPSWDSSRSGYSFTDTNGNELLFVFAGGYADDGDFSELGENGYYWLGSLYEDNNISAWKLTLYTGEYYNIEHDGRCVGCTVRPVRS